MQITPAPQETLAPEESTGVTEALRLYIEAGPDANWEVVAGRMYRALVAFEYQAALQRLLALGVHVRFLRRGVVVLRAGRHGQVEEEWHFNSLREAVEHMPGNLEAQQAGKAGRP